MMYSLLDSKSIASLNFTVAQTQRAAHTLQSASVTSRTDPAAGLPCTYSVSLSFHQTVLLEAHVRKEYSQR